VGFPRVHVPRAGPRRGSRPSDRRLRPGHPPIRAHLLKNPYLDPRSIHQTVGERDGRRARAARQLCPWSIASSMPWSTRLFPGRRRALRDHGSLRRRSACLARGQSRLRASPGTGLPPQEVPPREGAGALDRGRVARVRLLGLGYLQSRSGFRARLGPPSSRRPSIPRRPPSTSNPSTSRGQRAAQQIVPSEAGGRSRAARGQIRRNVLLPLHRGVQWATSASSSTSPEEVASTTISTSSSTAT
jgi:hypothetical protein